MIALTLSLTLLQFKVLCQEEVTHRAGLERAPFLGAVALLRFLKK